MIRVSRTRRGNARSGLTTTATYEGGAILADSPNTKDNVVSLPTTLHRRGCDQNGPEEPFDGDQSEIFDRLIGLYEKAQWLARTGGPKLMMAEARYAEETALSEIMCFPAKTLGQLEGKLAILNDLIDGDGETVKPQLLLRSIRSDLAELHAA